MTNTYLTNNPLGSTSPKDLYDNASNFDEGMNSLSPSFYDRFSRRRETWAGMENAFDSAQTARTNEFNTFLTNSGFESTHLIYVDGTPLTVDRPTQLIDRAGSIYRVKLPATFPVALTGTWATDAPLLVDVADAALRQDLADPAGGQMVGGSIVRLTNFAALDAYDSSKPADTVIVLGDDGDIRALYRKDPSDTITVATGSDTFRSADGMLWRMITQGLNSGEHYAEDGAFIHRFGDRVFVGGATLNNGTNVGVQPDWLTEQLIALGRTFAFQQVTQNATLTGEDKMACNAILGGARTSKFDYDGNAIGILGVAINDNTDPARFTGAYGIYGEGFSLPGVMGPAYGAELDIINLNAVASTDPYGQASKQTIGLQLASGAEFTGGYAASAFINMRNNGQTGDKGIVFGKDAISGADGVNGTAVAIAFGKGHGMYWYTAYGAPTSWIDCQGTDGSIALHQKFNDSQVYWRNSVGKLVFQVYAVDSGVNYLSTRNAVAGAAPQLTAQGDDTNVDVWLVPKGTNGRVKFGDFVPATGLTIIGYYEQKGSDNVVRKLAVVG